LTARDAAIPDYAGNTSSNARRVTVDSSIDTYKDFVGSADGNDYYVFSLDSNRHFSLSLNNLSANADVQLLTGSGKLIQGSTYTGTTAESISIDLAPDTYYIRVYPNIPTNNTIYDLNLMATPIATVSATSADAPIKDPLLGVYYGNQGWNMEQVQALESWQGKKNAVVEMFTSWTNDTTVINNLFNQQLPNIWNNKNVPLITWEPFTAPGSAPDNIEVLIANGQLDAYINNWADNLKTFLTGADGVYNTGDDRRAYLRLGHEMNGNWYPWSAAVGGNSPTDFVNMWKHTKDIFNSKGVDANHLQWMWCVNHNDVGGFSAEQYYPGDAYVDWVAIDGYNWGTSQTWSSWQTPDQVFGPMISRLRAITNKPLGITEVGSSSMTSSGTSIAAKSQWTTDLLNYAVAKDVKMVSWFNEDKETDWAVFGGGNGDGSFKYNKNSYKRYSAYKTGITPISYSGSDSTNPRLLSDKFFYGLM
jgi:beta-mannanase